MDLAQEYSLTVEEMGVLLQAAECAPSPASPLSRVSPASSPALREALRARGWLDADRLRIIRTLSDPDHQVTAMIPSAHEVRVGRYYSKAGNGRTDWIGCRGEGDTIRLSFPWTPESVSDEARQILQADEWIGADSFSAKLTPRGLLAFMATVDDLRQKLYESVLQRQVGFEPRHTLDGLARQIDLGLNQRDPRWLVTLLATIAPPEFSADPDGLAQGIEELAANGLLTRMGGSWEPTDALARFSVYWRHPLPSVAHERIHLSRGSALSRIHRVTLRGAGPLWNLDFSDPAPEDPCFVLSSIDGPAYAADLRKFLEAPGPVMSEPARGPACLRCGAPLLSAAKFCHGCGTPVGSAPVPAPRLCQNAYCGRPLREGADFCTACGTKASS